MHRLFSLTIGRKQTPFTSMTVDLKQHIYSEEADPAFLTLLSFKKAFINSSLSFDLNLVVLVAILKQCLQHDVFMARIIQSEDGQ